MSFLLFTRHYSKKYASPFQGNDGRPSWGDVAKIGQVSYYPKRPKGAEAQRRSGETRSCASGKYLKKFLIGGSSGRIARLAV